MRARRLAAVLGAMAVALAGPTAVATAAPPPAKPTRAATIPATLFGMHVADIQTGTFPTAPIGAVRLWDNNTAWSQVETARGEYHWGPLDTAVDTARAKGVRDILLVLGSTPTWAATTTNAGYDRPVPGAASPPRNIEWWDEWVTKVVTRYRGRITAYQVWNEASLRNFWNGTPQQMADLTARSYKIIKSIDPKALVVAASTTTRGIPGFDPLGKFYPPYLAGLKARGWPVDVFAGHFYPPGTGTPADRARLIQNLQAVLRQAGAPNKPLWDTESNFGLAGPGTIPKTEITGSKAAAWVATAYLDSLRLGVARSYWYEWIAPFWLLGIQMWPGEPGATGLATTYGWLAGARLAKPCSTTGTLNSCTIVKAGKTATIYWVSKGSRTLRAPVGTAKRCTPMGSCVATRPGAVVKIGGAPVWFGA